MIMGRMERSPTRMQRLAASDRGKSALSSFGGSTPAIADAGVVADCRELGIVGAEFAADPLDRGSDVRLVAIVSVPRDEADIVHAIVNLAIRDPLAGIRGQELNDVELAKGQIDIDAAPLRATDAEPQLAVPLGGVTA